MPISVHLMQSMCPYSDTCLSVMFYLLWWIRELIWHKCQSHYLPKSSLCEQWIDKVSCSRKQREPLMGFKLVSDWTQSQRHSKLTCLNCTEPLHYFPLQGCLGEVKYWFMKNMYTLGLLALALAVLQVCTYLLVTW